MSLIQAYATDVCVPISRLSEAVSHSSELLSSTDMPCGIVGHVGDGNFHCIICFDESNAEELQKCVHIAEEIAL